MDNWFNSKWFVRVISLAFAILIYVFVNIEVTTTQTDSRIPPASTEVQTLNDVPLDIRIDSEKYVVSGVPEYVKVSLEGPTALLTSLVMQRNFDVYIDLADKGEGTHTVDIEHSRIPDDINIYIDPKTIVLKIEERATKEFPVTVDFINKDQLPIGYEVGTPVITPETVTIVSSRSVIDQIAMVKAYIDVAGVTESINNREVPVNVYDSQGNGLSVRVEPTSAVISVDIEQSSKEVPIEVQTKNALPEGFKLLSAEVKDKEVEVFATKAKLAEIDKIMTEEIDLSEIGKSGEIEVKLDVPNDALVHKEQVTVNVKIEQSKLFENLSIIVHKDSNQTYEFLEPKDAKITVRATGDESDISELTADDIKLSLDVKGLVEGTHQIGVKIEGPENIEFTSEDGKVRVKIQE